MHPLQPHRPRLALAVALAVGLGAATAGAETALPGRDLDPVTVVGSELGTLLGTPAEQLALLCAGAEGPVPIPFQIDERGPDGAWILTVGPQASSDADGGRLDANDELVFMARDAGPRMGELPGGSEGGVELEITDPVTGATGFVYLVSYPGSAPRSPVDYVEVDAVTDSVEGELYGLTFSPDVPVSWAYLTAKDDDGIAGKNMIDRIKLRARALLIGGLVEWVVDEEQFRSVPVGYRDGAVRVLRRVENAVEMGMGFDSPSFLFDTIYYRSAIMLPSTLYIPVDPGFLSQDLELWTYVDMRRSGMEGWSFASDRNPEPMQIDGTMSPAERGLDLGEPAWVSVRRGHQGFVTRLVLDPVLVEAGVKIGLHYVDDAGAPDPPEAEPGQAPSLGFHMTDFNEVPAGTYKVQAEAYMLDDFDDGIERRLLDVKARPLAVRARPLR